MADLGTIGIAIEVRGKEALRQIESDITSVDRTAKSASKSMEVFEKVGLKAAETFSYMADETKRWLQDQRRILDMQTQSAKIAEQQATSQAKATQEIIKQRQAAEKLATANARAFQARVGRNLGLGAQGISASESASVFEANAALEEATAKTQALTLARQKANTALALGTQRAEEEARALRELNNAKMAAVAREDMLRQKYDESYRAMVIYRNQVQELNEALELGVLDSAAYKGRIDQLNQSLANGTIAMGGYTAQASTGMNKLGVVAQQTGYQVSDFLVQVQGGTNPLIAFSQQATQLAGLLYLLPQRFLAAKVSLMGFTIGMTAIAAGITIGIPLLAMLAMNFLSSGKAAEEGAKGVDKYKEAVEGLKSAISNVQEEINKLTFGTEDAAIAGARKAMVDAQAEIATLIASQRKVRGVAAPTAEEQAAIDKATASYRELVVNLNELNARQEALGEAQQMLNGGLSVAAGIQKGLVYEKEIELNRAKELLKEHAAQVVYMGQTRQESDNFVQSLISAYTLLANSRGVAAGLADEMARAASARQAALVGGGRSMTRGGPELDPYGFRAQLKRDEAAIASVGGASKKLKSGLDEALKSAEALQKQLEAPLVSAVGSISDAFGDFVARGLSDFKGFVKSILASFQNMIAQMIAMAVKNRIMLSLGIGGITPGMAAAGQVAGVGSASGMLGSFAGGGVAGTGLLGGFGAAMPSFLGGAGNGLFAVGANAAAAGGTFAATIGAAVPPLLAVAAVISLFKKKVTELDAGLKVTVDNTDVLVQSFQKLKKSSFLGLISSTSVSLSEASPEVAGPLQGAIRQIQSTVLQAAEILNIGAEAFNDFSYDFQVSLKGLTEEQKAAKITEELNKMGDAFANLGGISGGFVVAQELVRQQEEFKKRLEELRESDPVQFFIESFQADFKKIRLELLSGADAVATAIGGSSKVLSDSIVRLGSSVEGAANRVNEFLMGAFSNLNKDLGYGGGPLSSLNRITERLNQILEPAQNAIRKIEDAYDKMQTAHMELRNSADATADEIAASERAIGRATRSMSALSVTFSTVSGGLSTLTSAVNDYFSSQVTPALELIFPAEAQKLSSSVKAILGTIREGSVSEFEAAFVNLTDAFGKGTVTAEQYNIAMRVMDQVFRGNISLTEEYTKRQKDAVDQISKSFESLRDNLRSIIDTVSDGIRNLVGAREDLTGQAVSRESAIRYLSGIALSGQIPQSGGEFSQAVSAASTVSTSQFRTSVEMLRYIGQTSGLLNEIRTQAEQQLTDAQVQVQAILKIQETNQTSADALVSIESGIQAFLSAGGRIPQFANGGYHSGGLRIVGENGPELEATGPARIFNGNQISVGDTSELRNEVSQMRVELSTALIQIAKNTRKSADTLNKFDYQGMPQERDY